MTQRQGQRRRPVTNYDYGVGDLLGGVKDLWLESGLGLLNPNSPGQQLARMEPPENLTPEARANYIRHQQNSPEYMDLIEQQGSQFIDPSAVGKISKIAKAASRTLLGGSNELKNLYKMTGTKYPSKGVGKEMGHDLYVHKSASDVVPEDILKKASSRVPDWDWNIVKYNKKTGNVSLIKSPDFNVSHEPINAGGWIIKPDGSKKFIKGKEDPQIYHHKWQFVRPDYQGFDVPGSRKRSESWSSNMPFGHSSRIGTKSYWNSLLEGSGLNEGKAPVFRDISEQMMIMDANRTARAAGAVGDSAITPKYVSSTSSPNESILDFGSGPKAMHSQNLRNQGLDVTSHEFGENVVEGIHNPNALSNQYSTVFGSNVLNVQGSSKMLQDTLDQMTSSVSSDGRLIVNLPSSPRKGAWSRSSKDASTLEDLLKERFQNVKRVGGTKTEPLFEASNPIQTQTVSGNAPSVKSNIKYEDPTGLLDLSKLETDYPNIPQTREPLFVPKKEKIAEELVTFQSPEQQKKLTDWMEAGMKTGGMAWYNTNPLKKFAVSEYGERGAELYDRFMRYVAALSPNTAPVPNIKQASYFNTLDEAGVPLGVFQEGELAIPKGYGRNSLKGVSRTLASAQNPTKGPIIGPDGIDIKTDTIPMYAREAYSGMFNASAPKVGRFYQNLTGNIEDMATLDAGAMRSMAGKTDPRYITKKNPTGKRPSAQKEIYDQMEVAFNEFAHKQGVPPASAQAAIWTASAPYTGVGTKTSGLREGASFMEMLMQRVQITAKELNMNPKDVLKGVLEGNTVLKNMVGPIAAGATAQGLLSQENQ